MLGPDSINELKKIQPSRLIGEQQDDLDDFFLVLAVIYNDLKGIAHLQKDFFDNHVHPEILNTPSAWRGEFNGTVMQLYKIQAGIINEFLHFIQSHEAIFVLPKFKTLLSQLPPERKGDWEEILSAASKKEAKGNLGNKLMLIRHNVAYHYYRSDKAMRNAFLEFFKDNTIPGAEYAYYSLGKNLESSRFYYADAAVQNYIINTAMGEKHDSSEEKLEAFGQLQNDTFELIRTMNVSIATILRLYIQRKHSERAK